MTSVSITGGVADGQQLDFNGSRALLLGQEIVTSINTAAANSTLVSEFSSAATLPTVSSGELGQIAIDSAGDYTIRTDYAFVTDNLSSHVTVTAVAEMNLAASTGGLSYWGSTGANIVAAGGGANDIHLNVGSSNWVGLGDGADTVYAAGASTVAAGAGGDLLFAGAITSSTTEFDLDDAAADTVIGGAGDDTVFASSTTTDGNTVYFGSGVDLYVGNMSADTIVAGSGSAVAFGGDASLLVYGNSGSLAFIAGAGMSTVFGGSGTAVSFGLAGTSVDLEGSAAQTWVGGAGNATVVAGASSSVTLFGYADDAAELSGAGDAVWAAGSGNETLNAAASTGDLTMFGGSGADVVIAGSGNDTIVAGSGSMTATGGSGNDVFVMASVTGAAQSLTINDFGGGDQALLVGYSSTASTVTSSGGNSVLSLNDGSLITFVNVASLDTSKLIFG